MRLSAAISEDLLVLQLTVERLIDKPQPLRYCVLFIFNINQFCSALQDTKLPAAWVSSHRQHGCEGQLAGAPLLQGFCSEFSSCCRRWWLFWEWDKLARARLNASPPISSRVGPPKQALALESLVLKSWPSALSSVWGRRAMSAPARTDQRT